MFRPQQNRFLVGNFHLDTVSLHAGIILERVVNDAAVKSVKRLQLHNVTTAPDFFSGVFGLLDERIAGLGAITADINSDFGRVLVDLKQHSIYDVLKVEQSLTLPANEPPGIVSFYVEEQALLQSVFFHGGVEAEFLEQVFQD